jgi:hypothetical protein
MPVQKLRQQNFSHSATPLTRTQLYLTVLFYGIWHHTQNARRGCPNVVAPDPPLSRHPPPL